jgi:hypothetical protein
MVPEDGRPAPNLAGSVNTIFHAEEARIEEISLPYTEIVSDTQ